MKKNIRRWKKLEEVGVIGRWPIRSLEEVGRASKIKMVEKLSTQEDAAMETSNPSEFQNIIENPGLQNIVERIFLHLNYENLLTCRLINKSTRFILDNPLFWLKRWRIQGTVFGIFLTGFFNAKRDKGPKCKN